MRPDLILSRLKHFRYAITLLAFLHGVLLAGDLRGRVVSSDDGKPIIGATVSIAGSRFGASTGATGEFVIISIPSGRYTVKVMMVGYDALERSILIGDDPVQFNASLKESPLTVGEIVVRGRADRELETSGRLTEKTAGNIVNVVTAQTIEESTDRTAADVLQRVSGMSMVRAQGEGRYIVMRGLEQKYNNTLVDGIKIPSPESKDRFVPMDIFPSALFERIEVTKSLTPDVAGDAIGGSTNLMFRSAPDHFTASLSINSGSTSGLIGKEFNTFDRGSVQELDPDRLHGVVTDDDPTHQLASRYNPTSKDFSVQNLKFTNKSTPLDGLYSALVGGRILDQRLGILAAGSYQNTFSHVQEDFYSVGSDINTVDKEGHLIPYASTYDGRNYYSNKTREGLTLKTDFIADIEHQISASYLYVNQVEAQVRHGLQITIDGSRGGNDLTYTNRSALRTQTVSSISLSGDHFTSSPVILHWTLNYTDAVQDRPDEAEYSLLQNFDPYGHLQPFQGLGAITHNWRKNDDKQYLAKADGTIHFTADGSQSLQFGGLAQTLRRANFQNDYKLNPAIINGRTQPFTTIDSAITTVFGQGSTSGTTVYGYQNYKASESMNAAYAQYLAIFGPLQILGGVRWEEARDTYFTMAPISVGMNTAYVTTVDFLPGIHFRYEITPEHILRASLTETMSRPSYFDLVPASERSDNSQSQGNPNLKPALSTNFDFRYEYYPSATDMYSIGFYQKKILNPIEDRFSSVGIVFVTSKANGNPAMVYGLEAVLAKRFGDFGISANYSHVVSEITNVKLVPVLDAYGDPVVPPPWYTQKRPLQSQSPDIANLTLSYKNGDWGTGINLSYNYTGKRLVAVGQIDGYDTYEDAIAELDMSAEQYIFSNLKLSLKLINLLNSSVQTEVVSGDYIKHAPITILQDYNKTRGSIGLTLRI
jgi:TonB-dependent receptor